MSYHVRAKDLKPYSPANHTGTQNLRLLGEEPTSLVDRHLYPVEHSPDPGYGFGGPDRPLDRPLGVDAVVVHSGEGGRSRRASW